MSSSFFHELVRIRRVLLFRKQKKVAAHQQDGCECAVTKASGFPKAPLELTRTRKAIRSGVHPFAVRIRASTFKVEWRRCEKRELTASVARACCRYASRVPPGARTVRTAIFSRSRLRTRDATDDVDSELLRFTQFERSSRFVAGCQTKLARVPESERSVKTNRPVIVTNRQPSAPFATRRTAAIPMYLMMVLQVNPIRL